MAGGYLAYDSNPDLSGTQWSLAGTANAAAALSGQSPLFGINNGKLVSLGNLASGGSGSGLSMQDWFGNQGIIGGVTQGLGALSGLATGIGGYLNGRKQLSLMKDQLNFMKEAANRNYNAQVQTYNTALSDRYRGRASYETGDNTAYNDEYEKNKMDKI